MADDHDQQHVPEEEGSGERSLRISFMDDDITSGSVDDLLASQELEGPKGPLAPPGFFALFFNVPLYGHINPTLDIVAEMCKRGIEVHYYAEEKFRVCVRDHDKSMQHIIY